MIRVFIADDHEIVREGLRRILLEKTDVEVVGEAGNGDEVLAEVPESGADILLLDLSMPGPGFLETLKGVLDAAEGLKILVLSVHPEEMWATEALRAGASGYLTKGHSGRELVEAIRRVHAGGRYITQSVGELLVRGLSNEGSREPRELLSEREYQVLRRLGTGHAPKAIALDLGVSPKTVSTYRARILEKLGLRNNAELVRFVVEHGLDDAV